MPLTTSTALSVSERTDGHKRPNRTVRSTHRRRSPRPQLNLKLPAALIDRFRSFCESHGLSQRAVIEAAIEAHIGGVGHVASCEASDSPREQKEQLASAPAPTPAEVTEMRDVLERIFRERPSMLTEGQRLPNRHDANNALRWARRSVPDATPAGVADLIERKVFAEKQCWKHWGGVVVAAGDYAAKEPAGANHNRINNLQVAECQKPGRVAYGPNYTEWLAGREGTEDLWDAYLSR